MVVRTRTDPGHMKDEGDKHLERGVYRRPNLGTRGGIEIVEMLYRRILMRYIFFPGRME